MSATSPPSWTTARGCASCSRGMRGRLNAREREAAALCYLQGLSRAEAAARMGVSEARMRKLMEGRGPGRPGVAGKVGALVETIRGGGWCEEQGSLMRALAYGILDPDGERYRLALAHRGECPACRAYVVSLRGLAAALPPVLLPLRARRRDPGPCRERVHAGAAAAPRRPRRGAGHRLRRAGRPRDRRPAGSGAAGAGGRPPGGGWLLAAGRSARSSPPDACWPSASARAVSRSTEGVHGPARATHAIAARRPRDAAGSTMLRRRSDTGCSHRHPSAGARGQRHDPPPSARLPRRAGPAASSGPSDASAAATSGPTAGGARARRAPDRRPRARHRAAHGSAATGARGAGESPRDDGAARAAREFAPG